jgi:hypothetical protein
MAFSEPGVIHSRSIVPPFGGRSHMLLMQLKTPVIALAILFLMVLSLATGRPVHASSPADGVYDVLILDVSTDGDPSSDWEDDDFQELDEAPGRFDYEFEVIEPEDLSNARLRNADVLIIPWAHTYDWLSESLAERIVDFVAGGGTLIVHSFEEENGISVTDELLDDFGSSYRIVWRTEDFDSEDVEVIDDDHPLVSSPNETSDDDLSGWGSSIHSVIVDAGDAWEFATENNEGFITGCAIFRGGQIVVSGQDPEFHGTKDGDQGAFLMIENEITVGRDGICEGTGGGDDEDEGDEDDNERPPFIGGGVVGAFPQAAEAARANREREAAAASAAVAATPRPAAAVRPPSTGDGGLAADRQKTAPVLIAALATTPVTLGVDLSFRRRPGESR